MMVVLGLVGCAPVAPPAGRSEGSITWTVDGVTATRSIAGGCYEIQGVYLAVGGGGPDASGEVSSIVGVSVTVYGPTPYLEWDGGPVEVETRSFDGTSFVSGDHNACGAHVSTGNGVWIVTFDCDDVSGEAVITACERAP